MMIDCFHEWHFLTTACTSCLNQIHPRLKWLYGPVVTRSICQGFILIWLRSLLFLDRCMVLFSFYVEVFVENACVCMSCSVHLIVCCVHFYAVRLIIAFVDVNKTYLISSYLNIHVLVSPADASCCIIHLWSHLLCSSIGLMLIQIFCRILFPCPWYSLAKNASSWSVDGTDCFPLPYFIKIHSVLVQNKRMLRSAWNK